MTKKMTLDKVLEVQTLNDFGDKELRLRPNQRLEAFTGWDIAQVQNVAHIYHESNVPFQPEDDTAYFGTIKAPEIGGGHNVSIISDGSTEAKYMGLHSTGYTLISGVRARDIGKGSKGVLVVKDASLRMEDLSFSVGTNAETVEAENIFGAKVHYGGQMEIGWDANKVAAKGVRAGGLLGQTSFFDKALFFAPVWDFNKHDEEFDEQDLKHLTGFVKRACKYCYRFSFDDLGKKMSGFDSMKEENYLPNLDVSVLVLHGRNDKTVNIEHTRRVCKQKRNVQMVGHGGGHDSLIELLEMFEKEVSDFLQD